MQKWNSADSSFGRGQTLKHVALKIASCLPSAFHASGTTAVQISLSPSYAMLKRLGIAPPLLCVAGRGWWVECRVSVWAGYFLLCKIALSS